MIEKTGLGPSDGRRKSPRADVLEYQIELVAISKNNGQLLEWKAGLIAGLSPHELSNCSSGTGGFVQCAFEASLQLVVANESLTARRGRIHGTAPSCSSRRGRTRRESNNPSASARASRRCIS